MNESIIKQITFDIIGAAYRVHSAMGPGMLESVYEECLALEIADCGYTVERQVMLPVEYKGLLMKAGFRLDLLVAGEVIVELKTVEKIMPVHKAQIITYLKLSKKRYGLLLNFHETKMRDGIKRFIL